MTTAWLFESSRVESVGPSTTSSRDGLAAPIRSIRAEGAVMSKGTERFVLVAVIILLIERLVFYAVSLAAFVF